MNVICKKLICCLILLLTVSVTQAQIPQELINQAKALGMTDAQIEQEISKRMGGASKKADSAVTAPVAKRVVPAASVKNTGKSKVPQIKKVATTIYGQDVFSNSNLSFTPNLNIPTPADYTLAAGDEVLINVWGASELNLTQTISTEGIINIPNIGPISISGLTVEAASERIKQQLGRIMSDIVNENEPNTFVSVSLGKIRSISVNIVGEAREPGTYTLPSLSTLFNALYAAGGSNNIGTLRNIKVFRNNKLIATLDVYDYLKNGMSETNIRLENDDLILIEPYQNHVSTKGKLKRNKIFELKKGETLSDLIEFAGGFKGDAFSENIQIIRNSGDRISIATVAEKDFNTFELTDNDVITVDAIIPIYNNRVTIKGAVWRPKAYELTNETNSVKRLIEKSAGVKGDEFLGRALIVRLNKDFTEKLIAIDIKGILNGTAPDIALLPEDELYIPSIKSLREAYTIGVHGAVNSPKAKLDYRNNITVEDAIILAGGLKESAANVHVEVARRVKDPNAENDGNQVAKLFYFTLTPNLEIVGGKEQFTLEPFDQVFVRFSPGYQEQQMVHVKGEALFNGTYVISKKNQRLSDLVTKAGGITSQAYLQGANLKRRLSDDEALRLEATLRIAANQSPADSTDLTQLRERGYAIGINLEKALANPGSLEDVILRDGDILEIPEFQSTVKVSGSVIYPNSVTYKKGMSVRDCLSQAGGYTELSRKYPVVVYMNGEVGVTKRTFIFFKRYPKVEPGCEILVPMKRHKDKSNLLPQIMGISSSTMSMAAILASVLK